MNIHTNSKITLENRFENNTTLEEKRLPWTWSKHVPEHVICQGNSFTAAGFYGILRR